MPAWSRTQSLGSTVLHGDMSYLAAFEGCNLAVVSCLCCGQVQAVVWAHCCAHLSRVLGRATYCYHECCCVTCAWLCGRRKALNSRWLGCGIVVFHRLPAMPVFSHPARASFCICLVFSCSAAPHRALQCPISLATVSAKLCHRPRSSCLPLQA